MTTTNQTQLNDLKPGDSISIGGKELLSGNDVAKIADQVIRDNDIELGPATVGYLIVYPNISKYKAAKVIKCNRELKHYSGNDYIIEVSGDLWDMLDSNTREMLLLHELLKLNPTYKAKKSEWVMKKRKPDFSDFYEINDKHGNSWYKTIQATVSSLYDLSPEKESKVST